MGTHTLEEPGSAYRLTQAEHEEDHEIEPDHFDGAGLDDPEELDVDELENDDGWAEEEDA